MNYCTDLYIQLMYATFHGQVKEFFEGDFVLMWTSLLNLLQYLLFFYVLDFFFFFCHEACEILAP